MPLGSDIKQSAVCIGTNIPSLSMPELPMHTDLHFQNQLPTITMAQEQLCAPDIFATQKAGIGRIKGR
ncbi:hypothetical protein TevJSym_al00010 [endosymbiont of Tevnia jerichonana (vent Tica)]|uniref:Uncharacterized protein n=1 Tax=endosymbiont of Tevnia jerichonana (vent Tica) TaxID=1049564 RepID=G2FF89_9GAMM|nr:hypothetical protein TevJSym_al00010 [endosymbiont of Tevnia jerichonana (vent Tica)]